MNLAHFSAWTKGLASEFMLFSSQMDKIMWIRHCTAGLAAQADNNAAAEMKAKLRAFQAD